MTQEQQKLFNNVYSHITNNYNWAYALIMVVSLTIFLFAWLFSIDIEPTLPSYHISRIFMTIGGSFFILNLFLPIVSTYQKLSGSALYDISQAPWCFEAKQKLQNQLIVRNNKLRLTDLYTLIKIQHKYELNEAKNKEEELNDEAIRRMKTEVRKMKSKYR